MKRETKLTLALVAVCALVLVGFTTLSGLRLPGLPGTGDVLAVDGNGDVFKTNATASASPAGNSGAVQFNEDGVTAGTNDFIFDRTNKFAALNNSGGRWRIVTSTGTNEMALTYIGTRGIAADLGLTAGNAVQWTVKSNGTFQPTIAAQAVGTATLPVVVVVTRARYVPLTVAGAGTGSTNYTLLAGRAMFLGSSNVWIVAMMDTTDGVIDYSTVTVTNRSGIDWGIGFSSVSNSWVFSGTYGTNAPTVLSNNTALKMSIENNGSNSAVGYAVFKPVQ